MQTVETPRELIEAFADIRFPEKTAALLQELMDRNTEGQLTEMERAELEGLVELNEHLTLLRAQAMRLLGRKPL